MIVTGLKYNAAQELMRLQSEKFTPLQRRRRARLIAAGKTMTQVAREITDARDDGTTVSRQAVQQLLDGGWELKSDRLASEFIRATKLPGEREADLSDALRKLFPSLRQPYAKRREQRKAAAT